MGYIVVPSVCVRVCLGIISRKAQKSKASEQKEITSLQFVTKGNIVGHFLEG